MSKKLTAATLIGLMILSSVSHAYKDGEKMPCGKIYYSSILRDDTKSNAYKLASFIKPSEAGAGRGTVNRTN